MRIIVQRVSQAEVTVEGQRLGRIEQGIMALVGFAEGDGPKDLEYAADKVANLRIFPDAEGKMNLSVTDIGGGILIVPNFTLYGDCRRGRRPSFTGAGDPVASERLFADLIALVRARGIQCAEGRFGAHMHVALVNDGPVALMLDSRGAF